MVGICEVLKDEKKVYINDPENEKKQNTVIKLLLCHVLLYGTEELQDDEKHLSLPYSIDFEGVSRGVDILKADKYNRTGDIVNDYVLAPPIMLHLWTESRNIKP